MEQKATSTTDVAPSIEPPRQAPAARRAIVAGRGFFVRLLLSDYLVLWLGLLLFCLLAPFVPEVASIANLQTVLAYSLPLLVAALGLTLVLIIGGIDLSITATIALASVIGGKVMSSEEGWLAGSGLAVPAGVVAMLLAGAAVGTVNGFAVTLCRIPAFIATLATMMFVSGLAVWITLSRKIGGLPPNFLILGGNFWFATAITAASAWISHLVLSRTLCGKWLYAIGGNVRTSLVSGVPVSRVTFLTYVASGVFAGVSSILFTAGLETSNPEMARDNLLDIVGAVVIGGASLYGGRGRITGTILGVFFLAFVDNVLNLLGLTFYLITMAKGGVILLAAFMDALRNRLVASS